MMRILKGIVIALLLLLGALFAYQEFGFDFRVLNSRFLVLTEFPSA
jgi:hypothetical protein